MPCSSGSTGARRHTACGIAAAGQNAHRAIEMAVVGADVGKHLRQRHAAQVVQIDDQLGLAFQQAMRWLRSSATL
jgi:DNA polymerase III epsilon subunit-like protein